MGVQYGCCSTCQKSIDSSGLNCAHCGASYHSFCYCQLETCHSCGISRDMPASQIPANTPVVITVRHQELATDIVNYSLGSLAYFGNLYLSYKFLPCSQTFLEAPISNTIGIISVLISVVASVFAFGVIAILFCDITMELLSKCYESCVKLVTYAVAKLDHTVAKLERRNK